MSKGYTYTNSRGIEYFLNCTKVKKFDGKETVLYFFSKDKRASWCKLPEGRRVIENTNNSFPMLKKVV